MKQTSFDFSGNTPQNGLLRTASKTVRNFTREFNEESIPHSISVNLDWIHFQADCGIPEPVPGQNIYWLNNNIALEYENTGTPVYKHKYKVIRYGEPVANLMTHSRDSKKIKPGRVKVELLNHIQYSSEWLQISDEICEALKATPAVFGRIDIAIDGCNHVPKFLNLYLKQFPDKKKVEMKGKAFISPGILDKETMQYQHFKIGNSHKKIRIYNKTQELERSHKEYIRETWDKCGIDTSQDTWRVELRMDSEAIKTIKDFDYRKLVDPYYMLQIFRTQIENFFEFVKLEKDTNISRAKVIDLFNFKKLKVTLLDKIPRAIVRGAYKAKMAIHNAVANVLLHFYPDDDVLPALQHIKTNINLYDLGRYYLKRLPLWIENYQPSPFKKGSERKKMLLQLA